MKNTPAITPVPARSRFAASPRKAVAAAGQRGASLIEVMVVLVIILIGVFSVIQIFPIGFAGMTRAAQRTIAQRLAIQQMEQLKADDAFLPRGVLGPITFDAQGRKVIDTTIDPDRMDAYVKPEYPNAPFSPAEAERAYPYFNDVNKFRRIEGEAVRIPLPSVSGSLYTLRLGPMYMEPAVAADPTSPLTSLFLNVYGAPMRGIPIQAETLDPQVARGYLRSPATYLIDYGGPGEAARIMFPPANNTRRYRISLSAIAPSGTDPDSPPSVSAAAPFEMTVAPPQSGQWVEIRDDATGATYAQVIEGSETVSRAFNRLARNADFAPDDPYEYKLLSNNVPADPAGGRDVYANVGILAFNPAGATFSEPTAAGQQPFTAYLDYSVLDWHILREDREVPGVLFSGNDGVPIKLTLGQVKRYGMSNELRFGLPGEGEPDQLRVRTYRGLYGGYARSTADIQVFDLRGSSVGYQDPNRSEGTYDLGEPLVGGDYAERNGADRNADYWLNTENRTGSFRTGTIYVNPNRVPPGSQLRILYKAEGDWAVSVQKALERYEQALIQVGGVTRSAPRPTGFNSFGRSYANGENTRLYFNRSDLNKSVVVAFEYIRRDAATNDQDTRIRTQPVQLTIDNADGAYAYIDLAEDRHKVIPPGADRSSRRYALAGLRDLNAWDVSGTISGASVKVRVIWRDTNTAAARDLTTLARQWRIQDIDSYVARSSGAAPL